MQYRSWYSKFSSRFPYRQARNTVKVPIANESRPPTESLTPRANPRQASTNAFGNPSPLELGVMQCTA
jgi:hypothetical protein